MDIEQKSQIIIYQTEDGQTKIDVRLENETVWLSQKHLADLFQSSKQNISHHICSIFDEGELCPEATVKNYLTVQTEGARNVTREIEYYNLDMIISVGYRVKSHVATRFRQWAITGQTAAEIIKERANSTKSNMGLTSWRGTKPRKQDAIIAKNYMTEEELSALNNLVEQYLVFAEGQAMRRIPMSMADWVKKLDGFLTLNDRDILSHAGKVSHELAKQIAEREYDVFHQKQLEANALIEGDFEKTVGPIVENLGKKGIAMDIPEFLGNANGSSPSRGRHVVIPRRRGSIPSILKD